MLKKEEGSAATISVKPWVEPKPIRGNSTMTPMRLMISW